MNHVIPSSRQESVWDYPRPPRVEDCAREITVILGDQTIASTTRAKRVLETSHPPVYYIPIADVRSGVLIPTLRSSFCEWKGIARYLHVKVDELSRENAAWTYERPTPAFGSISNHVAFYASLMDACYVDDERVTSQPGDFYGGWITSDIAGPFKGGPGTRGW